MHWDNNRDGVGLDLTPFVTAANTAADVYAKTKAADAALAAAKARPPVSAAAAPTGARKPNWLAYALLGAAGIGGLFLLKRLMGGKRRR